MSSQNIPKARAARLPAKALHWSVDHDATVTRRVVTAPGLPSRIPSAGRGAYAIPALPDLRFRITSERLGHLDSLDVFMDISLESPGTSGAFFYSLCIVGREPAAGPSVSQLVICACRPTRSR